MDSWAIYQDRLSRIYYLLWNNTKIGSSDEAIIDIFVIHIPESVAFSSQSIHVSLIQSGDIVIDCLYI